MHPILAVQGALVAALKADAALLALIGPDAIFDAAPKGQVAPYVVVARHDVVPRDGDLTPGHEHRLVFHAWHAEASRKAVLAIVERLLAVTLENALIGGGVVVTHAGHVRTETSIDGKTGQAKAAVTLRFFSEAG